MPTDHAQLGNSVRKVAGQIMEKVPALRTVLLLMEAIIHGLPGMQMPLELLRSASSLERP